MSKMKIAILGCKGTTYDLLATIWEKKTFGVDSVITLPPHIAKKNSVAFYDGENILKFCRRNKIKSHSVFSYNLQDTRDENFFKKEKIDLLLVIGWERLIPDAILNSLNKFACGMHGSPYGLPKGRGRSPLNWSLLTNKNRFITYLFKYNPLTDAGDLIGSKIFEINEFDTILSLHLKNRIVMNQLLEMYLPAIGQDKIKLFPQPLKRPSYYPKRIKDDGMIDWRAGTLQIYNLIRATARPYPNAFTMLKNKKIFIEEAYPFDFCLYGSKMKPGTILDIGFSAGIFVVKTGDGSLLVKKYEGIALSELRIGQNFASADSNKILKNIRLRYGDNIKENEKEI